MRLSEHITWIDLVGVFVFLVFLGTTVPLLGYFGQHHMFGFSFAQTTNETSSTAPKSVTFEGTAMSTTDALPGHQMHQAVVVLPARVDGKLWVGTISWASSKPVELRLLYDYDYNLHPDSAHGTPSITTFQQGKVGQVAISLIQPPNIVATGGKFAGTEPFIAKAVAMHNVNGIPFTVTYAVDAVAKQVTK